VTGVRYFLFLISISSLPILFSLLISLGQYTIESFYFQDKIANFPYFSTFLSRALTKNYPIIAPTTSNTTTFIEQVVTDSINGYTTTYKYRG